MSLREPKPLDPTKQKLFRLPESVRKYLKDQSTGSARTETDVVIDALALDRDMGQLLAPYRSRLIAHAQSMGLDLSTGLPRVIADLVVRGLEAAELERKKKR